MMKTQLNQDLTFGYGRERLSDAFNTVKDADNWKNPISKVVNADVDQDLICCAVIFFTGSQPTFTPTQEGKLLVEAEGYYLTIGA